MTAVPTIERQNFFFSSTNVPNAIVLQWPNQTLARFKHFCFWLLIGVLFFEFSLKSSGTRTQISISF
jgi:hypothetical protein